MLHKSKLHTEHYHSLRFKAPLDTFRFPNKFSLIDTNKVLNLQKKSYVLIGKTVVSEHLLDIVYFMIKYGK